MDQKLPEAPASINFHGVTRKGWRIQFTLRDENEILLMERFTKFVKFLEDSHVTPNGHSDPLPAPAASPLPAPPEPQEPPPAALPVATPKAQIDTGEEYFDAELLTGSVTDGKTYWKVKGGKFTKYGVTIWPEVLKEFGVDPDTLDIRKQYDLDARAYYSLTDDGKPQKVVRLVRN